MNSKIAIVGLSALFPGAPNAAAFYHNIINRHRSIDDADAEWLQDAFIDFPVNQPGRIRSKLRAGIGDIAFFDPIQHGIMPKSVDGGDPDHYLSLRVASEALKDTGLPIDYDHTSTGVVVGRGTYFNRGFGTVFQHGIIIDQTVSILSEFLPAEQVTAVRDELVRSLPDFNSDMVGGVVPNIVSGRIANKLGLGGPNFLVDAACASSLIAVEYACEQLYLQKADLMLVGGVQASTPPQVHMVFDLLDALAHDQLTPFSRHGQGTVLSEGVGFVVLCRLNDAERLSLPIYAIVESVASSSDGRGKGLFAPSSDGQQMAIRRAYEQRPGLKEQVRYLETHGTGMPLGDETELRTVLAQFFSESPHSQLHLGNLKSLIGHCIPASGIAGLISATLAIKNGVFPPFDVEEPIDILQQNSQFFNFSSEPQPWLGSDEFLRTAAVNAFGFGGINSHLVLQQYSDKSQPKASVSNMLWPSAIFFLAAKSTDQMCEAIDTLLDRLSDTTFHVVALESLVSAEAVIVEFGQTSRGYIVAAGSDQARERLLSLKARLSKHKQAELLPEDYSHRRGHTCVRIIKCSPEESRPVFVYPGEGTQSAGMLRELSLYFPLVSDWLASVAQSLGLEPELFESILHSGESKRQLPDSAFEINVSTGLVFAANMSMNQLFGSWGIRPAAHVGHSTGQNSALFAGDWLHGDPSESVLKRACTQVVAMKNAWRQVDAPEQLDQQHAVFILQRPDISALTTLCSEYPEDMIISMRNCPEQYVIVVPRGRCGELEPRLQACCVLLLEMPISRPYHTSFFEEASLQMRTFYERQVAYNSSSREPVYSCTSGRLIESPQQAQLELASLMQSPVDFELVIKNMIEDGYHLFLECGHGSSATNFIRSITQSNASVNIVTAQSSSRGGLESFLQSIAALWSMGHSIDAEFIEHQSNLESHIVKGYTREPGQMLLNLLMPRARLRNTHSHSEADVAIARNDHNLQVSAATHPLKVPAQVWKSEVTINQSMAVLRDHTLPARASANAAIPASGVSVIPMAVLAGLVISASKIALNSETCSLQDVGMSRWVEATDINTFAIQLERTAPGRLKSEVQHNGIPVLTCIMRQDEASNSLLRLPQSAFRPSEECKPYIWPDNELYLHGMFHGPFYQCIKNITHCNELEIEGILETSTSSADLNTLQILDGLAQTSAFWAAPLHGLAFHTFPLQIGELTIGAVSPTPSRYAFQIKNTLQTASQLSFDGVLIDERGIVVLIFRSFSHSLVKLPHAYHACFADCEHAFYAQRLASVPREISIAVIDSTQSLDAYDRSNGFFPAIFRHLWFNQSELQLFSSDALESAQLLTHLSRKECIRHLMGQLGLPVKARHVMTDPQGSIHCFDARANLIHRLPSPVTLWHQGQCISIGSLSHRVSLVSVTPPMVATSSAESAQPQNPAGIIMQCMESALERLFGTGMTIARLTNVAPLNPTSIQAIYSGSPLMAGAFRLGDQHYGWAAVKLTAR